MRTQRSVLALAFALLLVVALGTLGYTLIEPGWTVLDSLYMTIITLTTIGFGEVRELSQAGRLFTIGLIVVGVGVAAGLISRIGQVILESGLRKAYGRRRMVERVKKLKNHYILCGYGRIGRSIAMKLYESGIDFVIIESRPEKAEEIATKGFPVVLGDASSDSTLLAAGIENANGTVLCINDDVASVNIALAARELNPEQHIISRGTDPEVEYRLVRAGADTVVYPMRLGGEQIAHLIAEKYHRPVDDAQGASTSLLGYELRVFKNLEEARTVGAMLLEKSAVRPIAIRRNDGSMDRNPKPDASVATGESLLVLIDVEGRTKEATDGRSIPTISWSEDYAVGVGAIDDDHRGLFSRAADFQEAVLEGRGREEVEKVLDLLVTYTEQHFHREEELMQESGYPRLDEHKASHRALTANLMSLVRDRSTVYSDAVWGFLERWLVNHIEEEDQVLAVFLRGSAAARSNQIADT
jgi:voltage-gated potassium channel